LLQGCPSKGYRTVFYVAILAKGAGAGLDNKTGALLPRRTTAAGNGDETEALTLYTLV
jgi:hypothetical protein